MGNVDEVPDSPAMFVAKGNKDSNEPVVNDESDAESNDPVLPQDGATTKRQKVGRS